MSERPHEQANDERLPAIPDGVVFLTPPGVPYGRDAGVDVGELLLAVWRRRWFVVVVTVLATVLGVTYALLAPKWYRAEVVLIPVQDDPTSRLMGQFGGLASLVGVNVGTGNQIEPLAVLKSRGFTAKFISQRDLLPVLFAKRWDADRKAWTGPEKAWPDIRDGVVYFDRQVRDILQDRKTGIVTIAVEWKDPALAAAWANQMADEINVRMRARAVAEAEANVRYLRDVVRTMDVVSLQQPVARLLEVDLQKLMLAKNSAQYAFKIVDAAQVPKKPLRPRKKLVVAAAFFAGLSMAILIVLGRHLLRGERGVRDAT